MKHIKADRFQKFEGLCPYCGSGAEGKVIESRLHSLGKRRRRECCGARFSTIELREDTLNRLIEKAKDATTESNRDRINELLSELTLLCR